MIVIVLIFNVYKIFLPKVPPPSDEYLQRFTCRESACREKLRTRNPRMFCTCLDSGVELPWSMVIGQWSLVNGHPMTQSTLHQSDIWNILKVSEAQFPWPFNSQ